jgi:hypothetical protein
MDYEGPANTEIFCSLFNEGLQDDIHAKFPTGFAKSTKSGTVYKLIGGFLNDKVEGITHNGSRAWISAHLLEPAGGFEDNRDGDEEAAGRKLGEFLNWVKLWQDAGSPSVNGHSSIDSLRQVSDQTSVGNVKAAIDYVLDWWDGGHTTPLGIDAVRKIVDDSSPVKHPWNDPNARANQRSFERRSSGYE